MQIYNCSIYKHWGLSTPTQYLNEAILDFQIEKVEYKNIIYLKTFLFLLIISNILKRFQDFYSLTPRKLQRSQFIIYNGEIYQLLSDLKCAKLAVKMGKIYLKGFRRLTALH